MGKHNDLTYTTSHSSHEKWDWFPVLQSMSWYALCTYLINILTPLPPPHHVYIYTFIILFKVIHVSVIYSPLAWKEDMINAPYSQNVRLPGLWCDICNSIIFTAFCCFTNSIKLFCVVIPKFQKKWENLFTGLEKSKSPRLTPEWPIVPSLTGAGFDTKGRIPLPLELHGSLTLKGVCTLIGVGPVL